MIVQIASSIKNEADGVITFSTYLLSAYIGSYYRKTPVLFVPKTHPMQSCLLHILCIQGSELHHGSNDELPPHDINNRETVRGPGGRYRNDNRLPGSVLLAKERLVQRLRGVSVSRNRFVAKS